MPHIIQTSHQSSIEPALHTVPPTATLCHFANALSPWLTAANTYTRMHGLQNLYEQTDHTIMHRYMATAAQPGGGGQRSYGLAGSAFLGGRWGGHAAGMGMARAPSPGFDLH